MGSPMELKPDMSVTDLAFTILKKHGKPMHFKQLISEVMQVKAISQENPGRLIAQMHTEINLDSRFIHQGGGEWGLREWQPKTSRVVHIKADGTAGRVTGLPSGWRMNWTISGKKRKRNWTSGRSLTTSTPWTRWISTTSWRSMTSARRSTTRTRRTSSVRR